MQFHLVSKPVGGPEPSEGEVVNALAWGSLSYPERVALSSLLGRFTSTPERCWFCVWEGYGLLDDHGESARVELPHRNYLLYSADLARVVDAVFGPGDESPNLWWPDDRAWFVATEIDYAWTYVGGTRELIGEILASLWLEALPARLTDLPFRDGDRLNAALDGIGEPDEDPDHRA